MQEDRQQSRGPARLKNIARLRQKESCVFLGSGTSINRISCVQWCKIIADYDIWTVNNWVYHPTVVPTFYHVEVKWYNYDLIQRRLKEKQKQYSEVTFLFPYKKTIGMKDGTRRHLHEVTFKGAHKYHYQPQGRDPKRTHERFNADYPLDPRRPTKSYDMSLTTVFELMYHARYKNIITFGVDLKDSFYFWSDGDPKYGEVHHLTNKAHEDKDPNEPHATHRIKDFIVDFDHRWMRPQKRQILVGHEDTTLFPDLERADV